LLPDVDELFRALKTFGEKRNWHLKYAKFNRRTHQSLLAHSLNVSSLSYSLLDYLDEQQLIKATEKLRIQALLTGFLHDAGKEKDSYQKAVEDFLYRRGIEPLDFGHQQDMDLRPVIEPLRKYVESQLPFMQDLGSIWEEIIWSVSQMGRREDAAAISRSFEKAPSNDALICKEVVHLADVMMSKLSASDVVSVSTEGRIVSKLQLTYSKVSVVRGVLTQFLHSALESQFADAGFRPVQWFPDATVYVGRADAKMPRIDSTKLIESVVEKMQDLLNRSRPLQMAKAAYGNLRAQVIAAPEFLFANNEIIHEFWQYISRQRFAKPSYRKLDELKDTERRIYNQISGQLSEKDESIRLTFLTRFLADFNLLIVLYAARKELVEASNRVGSDSKKIEEETASEIQETLAQVLEIPLTHFAGWPEIALQTKAEKRIVIAQTLWSSPYYTDPDKWQKKFLEALEKATIGLADIWRRSIPNKYATIARLLTSDISHPLDPEAILGTVKDLNAVITAGKTGHGTSTCQLCGGVAVYEAQAQLFGNSEIYHDNLVAGSRVGGGNKIRVCELCDFEEKLRSVFMTRGQEPFSIFYIIPHLAISRNQQLDWQKIANEIMYNQGRFPPLLRVNRWAEFVIKSDIPYFLTPLEKSSSFFSEKELAQAIQDIANDYGLEEDLSSMIDPPLDASDGKAVASYLNEGKCRLKERYAKRVYEILNRLEPVYLSPNFILLLTTGTVKDQNEPESSAAIKWLFFRCMLARLFSATVLEGELIKEEDATLGYTIFPSNIVLKSLGEKVGVRKGWIPIPHIERALKKLSALILVSHELSREQADYGSATLLRLLDEEPGRVLVRVMNKKQAYPKKVISYLDAWSDVK